MDEPRTFGLLLRRHRQVLGLSQEQLAEKARLSCRTIGDLERGLNLTPRKDTLLLLLDALGVQGEERAAVEAMAFQASRVPVRATVHPRRGDAVLVGRAAELTLLLQHLAQTPATATLLLLAGEPGIGKTRLLQEAARRAPVSGWTVLAGGCHRRDGQEPFAPLLGALAGYLAHLSVPQTRRALEGCAWLVKLLPELAQGPIEPLPSWTLPPEQERRLLFAAVRRFLAQIAGPAGTLVVLDDLQRAGPDAHDLLGTLLTGVDAGRLRVVAAYRDTEVQPQDPLGMLLADLAHRGLVRHRPLGPLA
jgi:transcriptional regulator with XRE-family HTH domain